MDRYVAVVNLDYTGTNTVGYQRILKALTSVGWEYVETSAMAYDGDLHGVLVALEILAKALPTGGTVSAVTVQIQRIGPARRTPGPEKPANALRAIRALRLPD